MKQRPWPIVIIALVCIMAPIFNLIYSAEILNKSLFHYVMLIGATKTIFEIVTWILLPILVGLSILLFNNWSYYFFLAFMIAVTALCFNEWHTHPEKFSLSMFLFFECFNLMAMGYFLLPSVRIIYFTPQIRWWQQKPRFECAIEATLKESSKKTATCKIKNIAIGGVLFNTKEEYKLKDVFDISFKIENVAVEAFGRVVHKGSDGYGFMFLEVKSNYQDFKRVINDLKNKGYKTRFELPHWTEGFVTWAMTFLKTGKGLVPKTDNLKK